MSLSLIVMGASGRMGTSVTTLAREQGIPVAAMLERPDRVDELARLIGGANVTDVLRQSASELLEQADAYHKQSKKGRTA